MIAIQLARLLRRMADDIHDAYTHDGEWDVSDPLDEDVKDDYDQALATATALEAMADDPVDPERTTWQSEIDRLRTIERAATQAYRLAKSGDAMLAFDALATTLDPEATCQH